MLSLRFIGGKGRATPSTLYTVSDETRELAWNDTARPWRWWLLALVVALYLGVGVFDHELWPPGEQAMAGVTWSMLHDGDLVVPDRDPLAIPAEERVDVQVVATMVGGRWVHNPPPWREGL